MHKIFRSLASLVVVATLAISPAFGIRKNQLTKLQENQHKSMHVIVMVHKDASGDFHGGLCTAYAVGPHTLLTAEHCNDVDASAVYIDTIDKKAIKEGRVMSYTVISRTFDHQDHMLLDVSGIYFPNTIELTDHVRAPRQGEHTYQWGNPGGVRDQYREGLVTGRMAMPTPDPDDEDSDSEKIDATGDVYLIVETVVGGDSGSAIFSAVDGQLIGVLTYGIDDGQFAGVYAIVFTQAQIDDSKSDVLVIHAYDTDNTHTVKW